MSESDWWNEPAATTAALLTVETLRKALYSTVPARDEVAERRAARQRLTDLGLEVPGPVPFTASRAAGCVCRMVGGTWELSLGCPIHAPGAQER